MDIEKKIARAREKHGKAFVTEVPVQRLRKPSSALRRLNRLSAEAVAREAPIDTQPQTTAVLRNLRRVAGGRS